MTNNLRNNHTSSSAVVSVVLLFYLAHLKLPYRQVVMTILQEIPYKKIGVAVCKRSFGIAQQTTNTISSFLYSIGVAYVARLKKLLHYLLQTYVIAYRLSVVLAGFVIFSICNLFIQSHRFTNSSDEIKSEVQAVNYWPTTSAYATLSMRLFDLGSVDLAKDTLYGARENGSFLKILGSTDYAEAEQYVGQIEQLNNELLEVDSKLDVAPYSVDLLLKKATIEASLKKNGQLLTTLEKIKWIDPAYDLDKFSPYTNK